MSINEQNADHEGLAEPLLSATERSDEIGATDPASERISRNVHLTLVFQAAACAGRSMWSQSVLTTLVYLLKGKKPEFVGYVTAVQGLCTLAISFPTGIYADIDRRDSLLRLGSCIGVIAIAITFLAIWKLSYHYLVYSLAAWGCFWGIVSTSLTALFADSIRTGDRSHYFTLRQICITLGNASGPLVSLVLFASLGDNWTAHDCAIVMAVGQLICFPACLLLCFFSDDRAEPEESVGNEISSSLVEEISLRDQEYSNSESIEGADGTATTPFCCGFSEQRALPFLVASADVISAVGSGMTIRYFPIFFIDNLKLNPVSVQVLYIAVPLLNATFARIAQLLSKRFGRCHVAASFKWAGIGMLFLLIFAYNLNYPRWLICSFFCFRGAFMNCTRALTKSLLSKSPHQFIFLFFR